MPYELSFTKQVEVSDPTQYINECCVGGDVVSAALLPTLQEEYGEIDAGEEDWGWFLWFSAGGQNLAVDVFTDSYQAGDFRLRLTASKRMLLFGRKEVDTPELERLKDAVYRALIAWTGSAPLVSLVR